MTKERPDPIARKSFRATTTVPVDKRTVISGARLSQCQDVATRVSISGMKSKGLCLRSALLHTVGVIGNDREHVWALRAMNSSNGTTTASAPLEHAFLARKTTRIIDGVKGDKPHMLRLDEQAA
jgi:GMP synthase PP-ATPase subunit